ncbi:MAG: DNA primase [Actinobacteria bacterium 13_2_20CM_2_72_6]|nr:MAG: DNA primase [Actinobacteria bacterium 13_2_20CM_2_72_6]
MARQSTGQRRASEPAVDEEAEAESPAEASELWTAVRVTPVEIALPKGVGYTLRAYRPVTDVTPTDVSEREEDAFPERAPQRIEEESEGEFEDEFDDEDAVDADEDEDEADDEDDDEADDDEDEEEDDDEAEAAAEPEEIPIFLGKGGRLYLFRSPEGLVEFVKSGAEHDLAQLDTWSELVEQITVEDVAPADEDSYELDLVVENLRGSRDSWDANLLIQAGEVARDLGYALRIDPIIGALSPGSPLDDLDEALRATESGGLGSFFARRKLKKIGSEAAPLGWRTIIGKISSAVDWRD